MTMPDGVYTSSLNGAHKSWAGDLSGKGNSTRFERAGLVNDNNKGQPINRPYCLVYNSNGEFNIERSVALSPGYSKANLFAINLEKILN